VLALAVPLGLLIGLSLGALGGGGSILTVPALVYVLGQSPVAATTGSLVIVGITSLTGLVAHARAGRVRVAQGLLFGVGGGSAVVPALVLALGFSMPVAVGTSLLVIAINSATALACRAGHGITIDWAGIGVSPRPRSSAACSAGGSPPASGPRPWPGRSPCCCSRWRSTPPPAASPSSCDAVSDARNTRRGTAAATTTPSPPTGRTS
jgi:hypothetical protein